MVHTFALRGLTMACIAVTLAACGDDSTHHLARIDIQDVAVTTAEDTPATVRFVVDAGSGGFGIAVSRAPLHGTFIGTSDPTIWTYTPATGYAGSDSLAVTATAGAASADATVDITIVAAGMVSAGSDAVSTTENTALAIPAATLLANDTDGAGGTLSISAVGSAQDGTVELAGTTITFTPAQDFVGSAGFAYTVTDGSASATGDVVVTVSAGPAPPVAHDASTSVSTATRTVSFALAATPASDGDTLTFAIVTPPSHGVASVTADGSATYTTAAGSGQEPVADRFTFAVTDEHGTVSSPATVAIGVQEICGNGFVEAGEQCDDGNSLDADGCDECVHSCGGATALADVVDPISGSCYATYALQADLNDQFPAAASTCLELGGHLPTIASASENALVQSLIAPGGTTWIGGANEPGETGFHWITGEPFPFTKLPANPTLPGVFNCVELDATGAWSLADCQLASTTSPICEFDLVRTAATFGQTTAPTAVAIGELQGTVEALGVVTANSAASTVTVRFGDFGFGVGSASTFAVGAAPAAIALGDLDGDGLDEIVTVSETTGSATILTSAGLFSDSYAASTLAFGTKASAVAIGDVDNDLSLDLLVADPGASTVLVRPQSAAGDGTFGAPVTTSVGADPVALAVGSIDGDALLDAVTANKTGNSASILIGRGDGTFAVTTVPMGAAPIGVAIADMDGDSVPDIATANSGDNTVTIFLRGSQTTITVPLGAGAAPVGIAANGDTLYVALAGDPSLVEIQNDGTQIAIAARIDLGGVPAAVATGGDQLAVALATPKQVETLQVAERFASVLAGTGNLFAWGHFESEDTVPTSDLVIGSTTSTSIAILRDIDENPQPPDVIDVGFAPTSITGGSLTTNLGNDLVLTDTANDRVVVLPADITTGEFLAPIVVATGAKPIATLIASFNGGARFDLAVLEQGANQVEIFELVNGALTLAATLPTGATPSAFAAGALAADLCNDLVVTNQADGTFTEYLCTSDYTFTAEPPVAAGTAPTGIAIAPFSSAHNDLVIVDQAAATFTLYTGDGAGGFTRGTPIATGAELAAPVVMDFDHDDHADVVIAAPAANALQLYRGVGNGTFRPRDTIAIAGAPDAVSTPPFFVFGNGLYYATAKHVAVTGGNRDQF